jgi:hypothetical protein
MITLFFREKLMIAFSIFSLRLFAVQIILENCVGIMAGGGDWGIIFILKRHGLEPVQNLEFWRCKRQNSTLQAQKEPENRYF